MCKSNKMKIYCSYTLNFVKKEFMANFYSHVYFEDFFPKLENNFFRKNKPKDFLVLLIYDFDTKRTEKEFYSDLRQNIDFKEDKSIKTMRNMFASSSTLNGFHASSSKKEFEKESYIIQSIIEKKLSINY